VEDVHCRLPHFRLQKTLQTSKEFSHKRLHRLESRGRVE
jgi:hypothetical protein